MIDDLEPNEIEPALLGKTITSVHVHADETGDVEWIGLTLSDGTELELMAHGMHTEGWINVERGRRIRDIYKVQA